MNKRIRKKRTRQILLAELAVQFRSSDEAIDWLEAPSDELGGRSPRQAIAEGETERVTAMLDAMNRAKAGA